MKKKNHRYLLVMSLLLTLLLMTVCGTASSAYPERSITYLIAFSPGGESDVTARMQQKYLEEELGTKIVITYKTGGGGSVCWAELARSKPDGYVLAGVNEPHTILQPLQRTDTGFETSELVRVCLFQYTPSALIVKKDSPFKTLDDMIAFAKENPGVVTIGSSGTWVANHLAYLLLEKAAGVKFTYIPFTGSGATAPALLGGHVSAVMAHPTMVVQYKDQVRCLAVASEERSEALPDVPTFKEYGYDTVIEGSYRGVAVPPGTPKDIVDKLAKAFKKANDDPEYRQKMIEMGFDLLWLGPEEYTDWIKEHIPYYKNLLNEFGFKQ